MCYTISMKTQVTYRLSEDTIAVLKTLAARQRVSHAAMVDFLIREAAERVVSGDIRLDRIGGQRPDLVAALSADAGGEKRAAA